MSLVLPGANMLSANSDSNVLKTLPTQNEQHPKPNHGLKLFPETELRFRGPFTEVKTTELRLSNPTENQICFKVKTTAPKRYCVRPNSGIVNPKDSVEVQVMLQPFIYKPEEKSRHKFMVQCLYAPLVDWHESVDSLFKDADSESIMDYRLRCVLELPEEELVNQAKALPLSQPAVRHHETESQKELKDLRDENQKLKENVARLRKLVMSDSIKDFHDVSVGTARTTDLTYQTRSSSFLPQILIILLAFMVGVLIGRFVL